MSQSHDDGGPAFPLAGSSDYSYPPQDGMTLRDWFAGMAVQGMLASHNAWTISDPHDYAMNAYLLADAMLERRAAKP